MKFHRTINKIYPFRKCYRLAEFISLNFFYIFKTKIEVEKNLDTRMLFSRKSLSEKFSCIY